MKNFKDNGKIQISGFEVSSGTTLSEVRDVFCRQIKKEENVNGWVSFLIGKVYVADSNFNLRFMFSPQGKLVFIILSFIITDNELLTWDDWNQEREIERDEKQKAIIKNLLGDPPYQYDWGEVVSEINSKDRLATITIRFF